MATPPHGTTTAPPGLTKHLDVMLLLRAIGPLSPNSAKPRTNNVTQETRRRMMSGLQSVLADFDRLCRTFNAAMQNVEFHSYAMLMLVVILSWLLFRTKNDFI
jgi:hypothetical protein